MTPISAIAMVGFTAAEAGAASGLFNMMRNLGGAIGTAAIETFFTKREQLRSAIITPEGGRSEPGRQRGCGCLISPGPICGVERVR